MAIEPKRPSGLTKMKSGQDKVDKSANQQAYIPYQTIQNNLVNTEDIKLCFSRSAIVFLNIGPSGL